MPRERGQEPVFRKVWSDLRTQILSDAFDPETPLPTEAQIGEEYAVSRQTVRRAFLDLVAEGLVTRVPGRGTFVTPTTGRYLRQLGSIDDLLALSADSELRVLTPLGRAIDPIAASRLRLSSDRISRVTFVRIHEGDVFCHTTVSLPLEVGKHLGSPAELSTEGSTNPVTVIGLLDKRLEQPIESAEQSITVGWTSDEVGEALGIEHGTPLLRVDRMYFDTAERPVELAVNHFHPDRYSYHVRLRRTFR